MLTFKEHIFESQLQAFDLKVNINGKEVNESTGAVVVEFVPAVNRTYNYFPAPEMLAQLNKNADTGGQSADNSLEAYLKSVQENINSDVRSIVREANEKILEVLKKHNIE
jgi:hypothetical protein